MPLTLALDFETANYPRESAIALGISVIENDVVKETRAWLFRPALDPRFKSKRIYIRHDFIDIHGITPAMLEDKGYFNDVWDEMRPYFEASDLLVAHNAAFDRGVLYAVAAHYDIPLPDHRWQCTVNIARRCWPGLYNHKLSTVAEHLGIALNHHEAESDAHACARIFIESQKAEKTEAA